jgi:hypothetical protein
MSIALASFVVADSSVQAARAAVCHAAAAYAACDPRNAREVYWRAKKALQAASPAQVEAAREALEAAEAALNAGPEASKAAKAAFDVALRAFGAEAELAKLKGQRELPRPRFERRAPGVTVCVFGAAYHALEGDFYTVLDERGLLPLAVRRSFDRDTGVGRGTFWIEFASEAQASEAIAFLNGREVMGRRIAAALDQKQERAATPVPAPKPTPKAKPKAKPAKPPQTALAAALAKANIR